MLDQPLPEFDYEKLKPAGKFKEVLWELWSLINGGVEELLVEKTDWAQVHRGTFTFQQGLLRDLREKMGYGTTEISINNLVADQEFKERTRKSYGSAMSSFYAMIGVKDPSEAATVSKFASFLIQDYVAFWREDGINDDKWLAKRVKERQFRKNCQVANEYFLVKHQHKLFISSLYSLRSKFAAADLGGKRNLLEQLEKEYQVRRGETLLWLA